MKSKLVIFLNNRICKYIIIVLLLFVIFLIRTICGEILLLEEIAIGIIASVVVLAIAELSEYERVMSRNKRIYEKAIYALKDAAMQYDDYLKERYIRTEKEPEIAFNEWFDRFETELTESSIIELGFYINKIHLAAKHLKTQIENPEDNPYFSKEFHEHFATVLSCCYLIENNNKLGNDYRLLHDSLICLFPDIAEW